jgi:hypothetical protein
MHTISRFKIQYFINKAQAQCATWVYSYYNINTYIWNKTKTQQEQDNVYYHHHWSEIRVIKCTSKVINFWKGDRCHIDYTLKHPNTFTSIIYTMDLTTCVFESLIHFLCRIKTQKMHTISRFKIQDFINKAQAQCATWVYSYYNINTYIGNKTKTQQEQDI